MRLVFFFYDGQRTTRCNDVLAEVPSWPLGRPVSGDLVKWDGTLYKCREVINDADDQEIRVALHVHTPPKR